MLLLLCLLLRLLLLVEAEDVEEAAAVLLEEDVVVVVEEDALDLICWLNLLGKGPWVDLRREQLLLLLVLRKMLLKKTISRGNLNTFKEKLRNLLPHLGLILTMKVRSLQLRQFKSWKY